MLAHIDADSFFASVLVRKDARLAGKPLLAMGMGGGCVIAASYEAKNKGVRTGMRLSEAKKLVPEALVLPSDFTEACVASDQIEEILKSLCPRVQKLSVDEWYVDMDALMGGRPTLCLPWAQDVRTRIRKETALSVSVGMGPSKVLAKIGSKHSKPGGICLVENGSIEPDAFSIEEFLRLKTAAAIPGIGRSRQIHAVDHGWDTAWDIATADSERIISLFGRPGRDLQRELLGEALSLVEEDRSAPKSVSRCRSFRSTNDQKLLFAYLLEHLTKTLLRMRAWNLRCRHVMVWIRNGDYRYDGIDVRLSRATHTEAELLPVLRESLRKLCKKHSRYTQIGLRLAEFSADGTAQYSLFEEPKKHDEEETLQASLDAMRKRYGAGSIVRGSALALQNGKKARTHRGPDRYGSVLDVR